MSPSPGRMVPNNPGESALSPAFLGVSFYGNSVPLGVTLNMLTSSDGKDWAEYQAYPFYTPTPDWLRDPSVMFKGGYFFIAFTTGTGSAAYEPQSSFGLLKTDGTPEGTSMIGPISCSSIVSSFNPTPKAFNGASDWVSGTSYVVGNVVSDVTGSAGTQGTYTCILNAASDTTAPHADATHWSPNYNVLAPEWFEEGGNYYLVVGINGTTIVAIESTDTTGFTTWNTGSPTTVVSPGGSFPATMYDPSIAFDGANYQLFFATNTGGSGSALYVYRAQSSSPLSGYSVIQNNLFGSCEGPMVAKIDPTHWRLYADIGASGVGYSTDKTNLTSWTNSDTLTAVTLNGGSGATIRHGDFRSYGNVGSGDYSPAAVTALNPTVSAYDTDISALSPAASWKLNDGAASLTAGDSNFLNPGTYAGGVTYGETGGPGGGKGILLNGSTGLITAGSPALLYGIPFTVLAWVTFSSLSPAYSSLIANESSNAGYALLVKSNGKLACYIEGAFGATVNYDGTGSHTLVTGTRYMLAMSWDGSHLVGSVDGASDAAVTSAFTMQPPSGPFTIGSSQIASGRFVNGKVWEVRYFPSVISLANLASLYAAA